jgi:hypothetical protein
VPTGAQSFSATGIDSFELARHNLIPLMKAEKVGLPMRNKSWIWRLVVVAGLMLFPNFNGEVEAQFCPPDPFTFCSVQCTWINEGFACFELSNPERACFSFGSGSSCGEDNNYECCNPSGPGGF